MAKSNDSEASAVVTAPVATPNAPANGTSLVAAPAPAPAGGSGCGHTLLIVVLTVICTLIVEAVVAAFVVGYVVKTFTSKVESYVSGKGSTSASVANQPTTLGPDQKALLKNLGMDPNNLPNGMSPQQVNCITGAIGVDRIQQIVKGTVSPGISDLFSARGCF